MSAYRRGAEEAGYQVSHIVIRELAFEPNLQFGYKRRLELEPDLLAAIDAIVTVMYPRDLIVAAELGEP